MGRGNNKFAVVNLNEIYGKKEVRSKLPPTPTEAKKKPPTPTENGSTGGRLLVLTLQKQPYLVAKEEQGNSTISSALKKESKGNPWAITSCTINPLVACMEYHENERRKTGEEDERRKKAEEDWRMKKGEEDEKRKNGENHGNGKTESKPRSNSNDFGVPRPGAAKSEESSYIRPTVRPSPRQEVRNWDDDERSSILPPHQQNGGRYFDDGEDAFYNNNHSRQRHYSGNGI